MKETGRRSPISSSTIMENLLQILLVLSSSVLLVKSESHSHFLCTTVTNDSTFDYPSYWKSKSLDDTMLLWYDSVSMVIENRAPWFKRSYGSLLDESNAAYQIQQKLQNRFEEYRNYMNDTEEFQILQYLEGCVLYDNGTVDLIFSLHYNGRPFFSFNVENGTWIADDPRAQKFADKNNNQNKTVLEQLKNLMVNECVPHIMWLLSVGSCMFNRTEQPVVEVTLTPIKNSTYRISCQAYGHYPKDISMIWYDRNWKPVPERLMEKVTLPLPDFTYLTWLSMNITIKDSDVYSCNVIHRNMSTLMTKRVSGDSSTLSSDNNVGSFNGGIIGICLAIVVLVTLAIFASVWWVKRRRS